MPQLKIAAVLAIAIILQLSLRAVWLPLSYIDFPLVIVVYIALQRDAWQALIVSAGRLARAETRINPVTNIAAFMVVSPFVVVNCFITRPRLHRGDYRRIIPRNFFRNLPVR